MEKGHISGHIKCGPYTVGAGGLEGGVRGFESSDGVTGN